MYPVDVGTNMCNERWSVIVRWTTVATSGFWRTWTRWMRTWSACCRRRQMTSSGTSGKMVSWIINGVLWLCQLVISFREKMRNYTASTHVHVTKDGKRKIHCFLHLALSSLFPVPVVMWTNELPKILLQYELNLVFSSLQPRSLAWVLSQPTRLRLVLELARVCSALWGSSTRNSWTVSCRPWTTPTPTSSDVSFQTTKRKWVLWCTWTKSTFHKGIEKFAEAGGGGDLAEREKENFRARNL